MTYFNQTDLKINWSMKILLHGHKEVARSSSSLVRIEEVWKSPDYREPRSNNQNRLFGLRQWIIIGAARTIFKALW